MTASVYKVVHPYAINNKKDARRLKATEYGAAPTLLALLHKHMTGFTEQVGRRLLVGVIDIAFGNAHNVLRSVYLTCLFTVDRNYHLTQIDSTEYIQTVSFSCISRRITACRKTSCQHDVSHIKILCYK